MSDEHPEHPEHPEPATEDGMVAALLRERAGYIQRGLTERVAEVDKQIKLRGHEPPKDGPPAKQETTGQAPRGRRAPGTSRT